MPLMLRLCLMLASLAVFVLPSSVVAEGSSHVVGWIQISAEPGKADHVTISGHALALGQSAGTFRLAVKRSGKGGKTSTAQAGKFSLGVGEDRALSTTAVNVSAGETLEIVLTLSIGGHDVSVVTVRTGAPQNGKEI